MFIINLLLIMFIIMINKAIIPSCCSKSVVHIFFCGTQKIMLVIILGYHSFPIHERTLRNFSKYLCSTKKIKKYIIQIWNDKRGSKYDTIFFTL